MTFTTEDWSRVGDTGPVDVDDLDDAVDTVIDAVDADRIDGEAGRALTIALSRWARRRDADTATVDGRRRGNVNRWRAGEPYGFVTDNIGRSWWASKDDAPPGVRVGDAVTFEGDPAPGPGRRYPRAWALEPAP